MGWDDTEGAGLTRDGFESLRAVMLADRIFYIPRLRPDEATVSNDGLGYRVTFSADGFSRSYSRHADRIPAFVPLEGRLALRLMVQIGGGLTHRQRLLCRVAAEAWCGG